MAGKEEAIPKSERAMAVGGSSDVGGEPAASAVKDHGVLEAEAAAAVDPPLAEEAAAAVDSDSDSEWVEMPLDTLCWILAKKRESDPVPTLEDHGIYNQEDLDKKDPNMLIRRTIATLQSAQDDFFKFQAWVREVYLRNGRVMVPAGVVGPKDELQKGIDELWDSFAALSVGDSDPEASDSDPEAGDTDSCTKVVLQSKF